MRNQNKVFRYTDSFKVKAVDNTAGKCLTGTPQIAGLKCFAIMCSINLMIYLSYGLPSMKSIDDLNLENISR